MKKNIHFENLIDKPIKEVISFFDCKLEYNFLNKNFYDIALKSERDFYNFDYQFISILTNQNDKVNSFSIKLNNIIDAAFYNAFVDNYGKSYSILHEKERQLLSEQKAKIDDSKTFHQELKQYVFTLEEVNFEDNPKYILWNKESYQIKITIYYEFNFSDITFSKVAP